MDDWVADKPAMKAHGHHFGDLGTLITKHIHGALDESEEVVALGHVATLELGVIFGQRIGHDQLRRALDLGPIGQLIVIGVGVVEESALLDQQAAGVDARRVAAIPA